MSSSIHVLNTSLGGGLRPPSQPPPGTAPAKPALEAEHPSPGARILPVVRTQTPPVGRLPVLAILLALALMALMKTSVRNVIIALVIPEIPRVIRVVRASVLSLREHTMVEGARALGARTPRILMFYILPALAAPLIVQATYICASAILFEAYLSFLGAGTPPHIPSWGNIMAEGKTYVQLAFWIIQFPGLFLALTVLAINLVGDGLRETLDVR